MIHAVFYASRLALLDGFCLANAGQRERERERAPSPIFGVVWTVKRRDKQKSLGATGDEEILSQRP